ncbi:hypothetical protein CUMW_196840 [Citrus unshiu]|uniref:Uncharacterized protein n=1 Tax=Citrus unshiu TaxID=55188 RepID=A0A2H5Q635_CITUN|nr:hypothetical protein CUMW_196840 [Citrus unshiu]
MAEGGGKVLYIAVIDEEEKAEQANNSAAAAASFRYTRPVLQSTLQLMGCKARHAFKISQRVFKMIRTESPTSAHHQEGAEVFGSHCLKGNPEKDDGCNPGSCFCKEEVSESGDRSKRIPFELYKRRTTVVVSRETFIDVVCDALTEYKYVGHNQRADLVLACRIRERKESVTVLLCGTSGCGKSTLSALLGSRLGITTVISTDSIRHMMRSFVDEKQNPLLWASTYHAGEFLDPDAVAEAKAKKHARKLAGAALSVPKDEASNSSATGKSDIRPEVGSSAAELISPKQMAIEGFKAQSEMVIDSLDRLITAWEERNESVVVEGVHLSLNFVCAAHSLSSKGMFQLIQRKGSSRHLMALLNTDGSVAKAWPVTSVDSNGKPILVTGTEEGMGNPMYGPLKIGKAESVNLQFGHFGISAWISDGCTSHAGSVDESRAETDCGSRNHSSCCSSPRMSDGHSKELKEEQSVHGSDEEVDDPLEADSDEDLSDKTDEQALEEIGSVDEESKSDEEYDDLAMQDTQGSGYLSDAEEEFKEKMVPVTEAQTPNMRGEKYSQNLDRFLRTRSEQLPETFCPYSPPRMEKNERKLIPSGNRRVRKRSLSISALGKHGAITSDPILSGGPQR